MKNKKIKKIVLLCFLDFILFIYENYIYEDFNDYTKIWKNLIKPAWFIKSIFIWGVSIVFFPLVIIHMNIELKK